MLQNHNAHYVLLPLTYMTEFSIVCKTFQVRNQQVIRLTITFPHSITTNSETFTWGKLIIVHYRLYRNVRSLTKVHRVNLVTKIFNS